MCTKEFFKKNILIFSDKSGSDPYKATETEFEFTE